MTFEDIASDACHGATSPLIDRASPMARDHDDVDGKLADKDIALDDDDDDYGDDDDNDDNDNHDEEDEEIDDTLWSDLKSAWKQHLLAIIVALSAALLGYLHLSTPREALHEIENLLIRHVHVKDYRRMANVTFCGAQDLSDGMMEFRISRELLPVLERYYQADTEQDDRYGKESSTLVQHAELDCAREQTSTSQFIQGFTSVYKTPSIQHLMRDPDSQAASLSFTGFAAKFINLSDKPKLLFWAGRGGHAKAHKLISEVAPMEAVGTATTPGQTFFITPVYDSAHHLQVWTVTADEPVLTYEDGNLNPETLSPSMLLKYRMQKLSLSFAKDYLTSTGRPWLSYFPRPPPLHKFWPAEYLGQIHKVTSQARHFLDKTTPMQQDLHLQMTVSSVVPRIMEIDNFLSEYECRYLIQMAKQKGMHPSTVDGAAGVDTKTRSSETAWLSRQSSKIVDTIYRRAADLLQIDESLFRHASPHHDNIASHHSISEDMQLVRYGKGQEYTPHHDFIYPSIANRHQPCRFATLLIYLHAPIEGGETTFPRSLQSAFHDGLKVTPKVGKAILFYNMLPDGNVDDLSQHGSNAVVEGEKWVANLWVWDPVID